MRFMILVTMRVDIRTFCSVMKMRATSHVLALVPIYQIRQRRVL